jgi:hypothetical protein
MPVIPVRAESISLADQAREKATPDLKNNQKKKEFVGLG